MWTGGGRVSWGRMYGNARPKINETKEVIPTGHGITKARTEVNSGLKVSKTVVTVGGGCFPV